MDNPKGNSAQLYFGHMVHWITIASCLIALIAPVFILLFSQYNLLNPNLLFGAIFEGQNPREIWRTAGVAFEHGDFWRLFAENFFAPDGFATFGIVLGTSVTLWALIPAAFIFLKKRQMFYAGICSFIMLLIAFSMSGLLSMGG